MKEYLGWWARRKRRVKKHNWCIGDGLFCGSNTLSLGSQNTSKRLLAMVADWKERCSSNQYIKGSPEIKRDSFREGKSQRVYRWQWQDSWHGRTQVKPSTLVLEKTNIFVAINHLRVSNKIQVISSSESSFKFICANLPLTSWTWFMCFRFWEEVVVPYVFVWIRPLHPYRRHTMEKGAVRVGNLWEDRQILLFLLLSWSLFLKVIPCVLNMQLLLWKGFETSLRWDKNESEQHNMNIFTSILSFSNTDKWKRVLSLSKEKRHPSESKKESKTSNRTDRKTGNSRSTEKSPVCESFWFQRQ
jgi:hypothetical protein